jgi:hypothetical protein
MLGMSSAFEKKEEPKQVIPGEVKYTFSEYEVELALIDYLKKKGETIPHGPKTISGIERTTSYSRDESDRRVITLSIESK